MAAPTAMSPTSTKATDPTSAAGSASPAKVPFVSSSWEHTESNQDSPLVWTPGTTSKTFVVTINAGGFLRGLWLTLTSSGGTPADGTLIATGDAPWSAIQSIELETVQGKPLIYPLTGWQMYAKALFCEPWAGDPSQYPGFKKTIANFAFQLRFFNEIRATLGVLPNTDARAKFRCRITVAPKTQIWSATPTTIPEFTLALQKTDYGQPDPVDILGRPTAQQPPGLAWQRFVSVQLITASTSAKWYQIDRVGNFIRNVLVEVRSSAGKRVALTSSNPIIWQLDNQFLVNETPAKRQYEMSRFYNDQWSDGGGHTVLGKTLPLGMYVYSRWHKPGDRDGMTWLPTSTASLCQWNIAGGPSGGTLTFMVEDLAPTGVGDQSHQFGL